MLIAEAQDSRPVQRLRFTRTLPPEPVTDALLVGGLAAATFLVHSLQFVLSTPFWVDESWVAVSTKVPLHDVPHVTSVTPIGWTLLLRTVFFGGEQGLRLLPLAFSALSVITAYVVGRTAPWGSRSWSRVAGTLAGLAVLLAPSSLVRNDLKPYTADAFVTLTLLLLVSRLERSWTRAGLAALSAACVIGFLISTVAIFVSVAAFGALLAMHSAHRNLRRVLEVAVSGTITAAVLWVIFLNFYQPHVQATLTQYWHAFYPPVGKGFGATISFLHYRGDQTASFLGMGPLLLALLLVSAGVVTLARSGRPALACAAPILLIEMFVLGAARKYPLFDERTSHFLTVSFAVFAAIGVAGLGSILARRNVTAAATVVALLAVLFAVNVRHDIRKHSFPLEDVRTATGYVAANSRPTDIILVSGPASWGFAYYWPVGQPSWRPSKTMATGFQTWYPRQPNVVVAVDRDRHSIESALDYAMARASGAAGGRIWIVRMHVNRAEDRLWQAVLLTHAVRLDDVIPCSLLLLTPLPSSSAHSTTNVQSASCYPSTAVSTS